MVRSQLDRRVVAEVDGAGQKRTRGKNDFLALCRTGVDCRLNGMGVVGGAVSLGAKVYHVAS
jgi:hypothetical protein